MLLLLLLLLLLLSGPLRIPSIGEGSVCSA